MTDNKMMSMGGAAVNGTAGMHLRRHMMMHMTFYWGTRAEVLFDGWPGSDLRMYGLSLVFVFVLAVAVEWLSHGRAAAAGARDAAAGVGQMVLYTVRCGLSYMLMLAVMSFNGGVFLAAIGGMGVGFFFFGSRAFGKKAAPEELPPMRC